MWCQWKPDLKHVKVWKFPTYVEKIKVKNLEARSLKWSFVSNPKHLVGELFYLHDDQGIIMDLEVCCLEDKIVLEIGEGGKIILRE